MKFLSFILVVLMGFGLVSCEKSENMSGEHKAMQGASHAMPMQQLAMLLDQAVGMMGQGAVLKQEGEQAVADVMLAQSADLLRRAMSGPEMAAMHKGGQGQSAMMQHTHALGAAAFDLLDLMMSSPAEKFSQQDKLLHHALTMAAQGASMRLSARMGMNNHIAGVMKSQANKMQTSATTLSQTVITPTAYEQAVIKVIDVLVENSKSTMKAMH